MENPQTFLKKLNWKINGRLFGFGTSSEADWKIIFISTMILAILVIVLSIFINIKMLKTITKMARIIVEMKIIFQSASELVPKPNSRPLIFQFNFLRNVCGFSIPLEIGSANAPEVI